MNLKQNWSRTKEVLGAYFRQGMHELGSAFYGPGTAAQPAEYGMIGTRTPGEVADGLRGKETPSPVQNGPAPSIMDGYVQDSRDAHDRVSRESREPERMSPLEPERD
ncbi:MAG TPA: hypothetical protein VHN77_14620 [Phycisphaerales bacterium]|nr:hypothetical protein [Phycisphaerales bacterium]